MGTDSGCAGQFISAKAERLAGALRLIHEEEAKEPLGLVDVYLNHVFILPN
jgi:hypothetical protein